MDNFMYIFLILLQGAVYNLVLFLTFVIALIDRKHRMGIFIAGVTIQSIAVAGNILRMLRYDAGIWMTTGNIFSIICSVVFAVGGYFFLKHLREKNSR